MDLVLRRSRGVVGPHPVGRQDLTGVSHRVSLAGKQLGSEKFRRTCELGAQRVRLPLEAVGIVRSALHHRPLASLFEFHDLELETDGVVFQSGIDHHLRAYPARGAAQTLKSC